MVKQDEKIIAGLENNIKSNKEGISETLAEINSANLSVSRKFQSFKYISRQYWEIFIARVDLLTIKKHFY